MWRKFEFLNAKYVFLPFIKSRGEMEYSPLRLGMGNCHNHQLEDSKVSIVEGR